MHSEKMAALGQLMAGVAIDQHPIGAIKSSGRNISESLGDALLGLPRLLEALDAEHRRRFSALVARATKPRAMLSTREDARWCASSPPAGGTGL